MHDLVELSQLIPTICLDIRYAGNNNFLGRPVYPSARCFLRKNAAIRLARVQKRLWKEGRGLVVYDGYRPMSVQKIFWEILPDDRFVADPATGSKHNRGSAVDVGLMENGVVLLMPSEFDDFTEKASHGYLGGSDAARANRRELKEAMMAEGFIPYEHEWWHYDDPDWQSSPLLDLDLDSLRPSNLS